MTIFRFEQPLIPSVPIAVILMTAFEMITQRKVAASWMIDSDAHVLLYCMTMCASMMVLSALGAALYWYYTKVTTFWAIVGLLGLAYFFGGYAFQGNVAIRLVDTEMFNAWKRNHMVGAFTLFLVGSFLYFIKERPELEKYRPLPQVVPQ